MNLSSIRVEVNRINGDLGQSRDQFLTQLTKDAKEAAKLHEELSSRLTHLEVAMNGFQTQMSVHISHSETLQKHFESLVA